MKFVLFLVGTLVLLQNAPKPEQPCLEHFESPRFPPLARQVAIQGKVLAAAIVDRQGNVSSAEAITGHPLFKEVAVANLRTWKFQPNSVADSRIEVSYEFLFEDTAPSLGEAVSYDLPNRVRIRASPPPPMSDPAPILKKKHWWSRN